jgi:hypothetical protein
LPRWCKQLFDANGKWVGTICGTERYRKCSVPECRAHGRFQCDFAVATRQSGTCDRYMCERHRTRVGPDRDFCPPHQRIALTSPGLAQPANEQLLLPALDDLPQGKR